MEVFLEDLSLLEPQNHPLLLNLLTDNCDQRVVAPEGLLECHLGNTAKLAGTSIEGVDALGVGVVKDDVLLCYGGLDQVSDF